MTRLSSRIRRVLNRLQKMINPTQPEADQLSDEIASLVLAALRGGHLSRQLLDLKNRCEAELRGELYADANQHLSLNPHRHFFMPFPGSLTNGSQTYWPLQLLLQMAARSPKHGNDIANALGIDHAYMVIAVNDAAKATVAFWGREQLRNNLITAVQHLQREEDCPHFHLNGNVLSDSIGNRVRLSAQQVRALELIAAKQGDVVTKLQFRDAGILNVTVMKSRLMKKLKNAGIHLPIHAGANDLRLTESCVIEGL